MKGAKGSISLDTKVGQIKPEEFKRQMQEPVAANKVTSLKVRGAHFTPKRPILTHNLFYRMNKDNKSSCLWRGETWSIWTFFRFLIPFALSIRRTLTSSISHGISLERQKSSTTT